jgi:alkylhydroperoxidase family enzyme
VDTDPAGRVLAGLARLVTEAPWTLERADVERAHAVGLSDDAVVTVVALSAAFNYLNRMADAVGIDLDYDVVIHPPPAVPDTPAMARPGPSMWPDPDGPRLLELSRRPVTAEAVADLRAYVMEREAPLSIEQRQVIARAVAERVGDAATVRRLQHAGPRTELDRVLEQFADVATLAPWRLGAGTFEALRAASLPTPAIFDVMAVASFANLASRLDVALAALSR